MLLTKHGKNPVPIVRTGYYSIINSVTNVKTKRINQVRLNLTNELQKQINYDHSNVFKPISFNLYRSYDYMLLPDEDSNCIN